MENPIKIYIAKNGLSEGDSEKIQRAIVGLDNVKLADASEIPPDAQIVTFENVRNLRHEIEPSTRVYEIREPYIPYANYNDGKANRRARRAKERQNKKRK